MTAHTYVDFETTPDVNRPLLLDATPAFEVCRWALRQKMPAAVQIAACDTLAQSPEWTDQALAREYRNAFWSNPASETGANFNRNQPAVMARLANLRNPPREPEWARWFGAAMLIGAFAGVVTFVAAIVP